MTEEMIEKVVDGDQVAPSDAGIGGHVMCPRCKWDTRKMSVPIGEDDKKEYLRNLLGGVCFTKEFSFFGGQFQVTFTDLTSVESDKVISLIRQILSDEMLIIKAMKLKILFSTVSVTKAGKTVKIDRDRITKKELTVEEAFALFDELYGDFPETIGGLISRTYQVFSELLIRMAEGGLDENFWKGAGLG